MKQENKNLIWYVGYGIAIALFLLVLLTDFSKSIDGGITVFASMIMGLCHSQLFVKKMMKAPEVRREAKDERNLAIKAKAESIANFATDLLLLCATPLFFALDYTLPAFVTLGIVLCNLLIVIAATKHLEKNM